MLIDAGTPLSLANEVLRMDQTRVEEGVDGWVAVRCHPRAGISLHEELLGAERRGKKRLPICHNPLLPSVSIFLSTHTIVYLITFMPGGTKHSKQNLARVQLCQGILQGPTGGR